jgi:hypothetical protein
MLEMLSILYVVARRMSKPTMDFTEIPCTHEEK